MKRILIFFTAVLYSLCNFAQSPLKTGDILFITSGGAQGKAIQLATRSIYTHVGIVFVENGTTYVYHAVEPVMKSTLKEFIQYSSDGKYVARRLKQKDLLNDSLNNKMRSMAEKLLGKHYDIFFSWNDDQWYCSEFVWKLYERNYHIKIGSLRPLKDFDLASPEVQAIMKKRYGDKIPYDEKMISPQDMHDSPLLENVNVD